MKKMSKILLGGLLCATGFLFSGKVSAKAPTEYPVFTGKNVLYNKTTQKRCWFEGKEDGNCKKYTVLSDLGISSDTFTVKDGDESITLNKIMYTDGSVISATRAIDFNEVTCDSDGNCGSTDPAFIDGVTKIKNFTEDELKNIIENAQKYDNIYTSHEVDLEGYNLVIPKDVTFNTPYLNADSLNNNGVVDTAYLETKSITGNGIINLDHDVFVGMSFYDDTLDKASRIIASPISGNKLNFKAKHISDGAPFCLIGKTTDFTKDEAQEFINMYNKALGASFEGYEVKLNSRLSGDEPDDSEYYYGVLAKKEVKIEDKNNSNVDTKNDVKNPSTGDPTIITLITLIVSGALFTITYKKIKQK